MVGGEIINMSEAFITLGRMILIGRLSDVHMICFFRTMHTLNYSKIELDIFSSNNNLNFNIKL